MQVSMSKSVGCVSVEMLKVQCRMLPAIVNEVIFFR